MTDVTKLDFNPGGIQDRIDNRDYLYTEVGFGTETFDWNTPYDVEVELGFKLPVKDQGSSFSCGGQAWSTYIGVLEALGTGSFEERSAKYIYSQVYAPGGGSRGRDCAEICVNQGVSRETVLSSYENGNTPTEAFMQRSGDITFDIRQNATSSKLLSYAQVGNNINDIARALKSNHGIILGIDGSNNGTWASAFPKPPKIGDTMWRHWIYAGKAKLINGVKHIGCLNSWGSHIGEGGWQWISEEYFNTFTQYQSLAIWSAWTHVFGAVLVPVFHHTFLFDMKFGQSGEEIKALQKALQINGTFPIAVPPTGYFGNITLTAVIQFQKKYGIAPAVGYCGPLTRGKLNELFSG